MGARAVAHQLTFALLGPGHVGQIQYSEPVFVTPQNPCQITVQIASFLGAIVAGSGFVQFNIASREIIESGAVDATNVWWNHPFLINLDSAGGVSNIDKPVTAVRFGGIVNGASYQATLLTLQMVE